jgi:CRP/FNR family transcriptional regulator, cyclic AMP receptor protein
MSPQAWHALLVNGAPRRYVSGEVLVRQGELGSYVLALNHGVVKVSRVEADGHELLLAVRGRGEIIGENTYLGDQARTATVTAV